MNNVSLKPYNTFGFDAKAKYFEEVHSLSQLLQILNNEDYKNLPKLYLGGGSNVLLLADFDGLVIKINLKGIEIIDEDTNHATIKAGAGEIWHDLVLFSIDKNLCGLENMSLIPGTVGAAPMQNIGAYGAEVKDTFFQLEALNLETLKVEQFDREKCAFGYRESFFKHEGKNKYVILSVSFKLSKTPAINIEYGAIKETLIEMGVTSPNLRDVSNAVIQIRKSKLPNPAEIGNAGSFFKNPEIPTTQFEDLKREFPALPGYKMDDNSVKVPAGWLIEQTGWKGQKVGNVGVHNKQALVLVHFGSGQGSEIVELAKKIQESVYQKFGIQINPEVNYIK